MASNIPKEYQKSYTWDAIVFNDGATCVRIDDDDATRDDDDATDRPHHDSRDAEGFANDAEPRGVERPATGFERAFFGE